VCELIAKNDCYSVGGVLPFYFPRSNTKAKGTTGQNHHYFSSISKSMYVCVRLFRNVVQRKNALFLLIHFMDMIPE